MESDLMLLIFGLLLLPLGIVNLMGNISTVHRYNRRKVSQEDAPKYGRLMGIATLVISGSAILTAILQMIFPLDFSVILLTGAAAGVVLILVAQFKYNKGIF